MKYVGDEDDIEHFHWKQFVGRNPAQQQINKKQLKTIKTKRTIEGKKCHEHKKQQRQQHWQQHWRQGQGKTTIQPVVFTIIFPNVWRKRAALACREKTPDPKCQISVKGKVRGTNRWTRCNCKMFAFRNSKTERSKISDDKFEFWFCTSTSGDSQFRTGEYNKATGWLAALVTVTKLKMKYATLKCWYLWRWSKNVCNIDIHVDWRACDSSDKICVRPRSESICLRRRK